MKKFIAWFLVLALTAAVSIGATLAYLTDTDEDVNVMTIGKVKIDQLEYERIDTETTDEDATVQEFHDNKPLYPGVYENSFDFGTEDNYVNWGQIGKDEYTSGIWNPDEINNEVDKMVFVKNKGDYDAFVRTVFAFEAGNYETLDEFNAKVHLNLNDTDWSWEWVEEPVAIGGGKYFVATATYNRVLEPGAYTEISLSQIALDKTATNADVEAFGDTYNVLVKSQAIQADGFDTALMALNDGFGEITATAVPFITDQPVKGVDVRSALRFYRGDAAQPIHTEITNVVFGLNKDHPEIVNNYDGTLVTEEQDVETYAYYVQKDGKYTVYFLANDKVYLPKDSGRLFQEMNKLTTVDTSNLNTSRTELMNHVFYKCSALKNIDVSGFVTSKVTNLKSFFNECSSLTSVDVSDWDTSNVTDMSYLFRNASKLSDVDLSGWDVGSVEKMEYMFRTCNGMKEIDLSGWDVSNVRNMEYMFSFAENIRKVDTTGWNPRSVTNTRGMFMNCYKLEEIPGSADWNLSNNTSLYYMFQMCYALEYLDVSKWDCSNVTNMQGMFYYATGLKTLEGLENWDTSEVTNMQSMLSECHALEDADVSNFKTGNATTTAYMFFKCHSLKEIDVSKWDTSKVENMQHMFFGCVALEKLDVANWNTGKVKNFYATFADSGHNTGAMLFTELAVENWDVSSAENMEGMFYGCGDLIELDLSKWDTGNVKNFRHTFADCFDLERIDLTGWDTSSVVSFDGMFNDCYTLQELDMSDFDTENATNFYQFFEGCAGLKTVKGMENWNTSKVTTMAQLFNSNGKNMQLEYVDLSGWDTSSMTDTGSMFNGCTKLTTVYVGDGWDMSKVTGSGAMFASCPSLTGANGTRISGNPTDKTYARVDMPAVTDDEGNVITEAVPGYLTHINDKPVTNP
ncbi:MAG: BspA family leucine-rich repeat surface protein [Bacteroidaceae bacterium]|nr:BspA family leucine-rich repeat surface protein [Bacteroidaceae bacterium]